MEWSKHVTAGYLDQHAVLGKAPVCRDVLRTAFDPSFQIEARINEIYMNMAEEGADVDALMEEMGAARTAWRARYTLDT